MSFRRVASLDDLWSGEMMGLEVDGREIVLINIDDRVYAYPDACPHQKSRLSEGDLTGTTLRCARHSWEFKACTGHGINPQNTCLKMYLVAIESRDILLDLDDESSTEGAAALENQR
jgi:toluene monooxygenase system ferredoxin subunit